MGALIRMAALIGIGALIDKNTFEGGGGAYSEGGAYWKERAKSNHYGSRQRLILGEGFPRSVRRTSNGL